MTSLSINLFLFAERAQFPGPARTVQMSETMHAKIHAKACAKAHTRTSRQNAGLPALSELGADFLLASRLQRLLWSLLPLTTLAIFSATYALRYYALLPVVILAHFIVSTTFTHDVVHGSAGAGKRTAEWLLFGMSLLLLESGHAFRHAHLYHHSHCLEDDDFEGSPARMSLLGALLAGPLYLPRHWLHAYRLTKRKDQRRWLLAESLAPIVLVSCAALLLSWSAAPLTYFGFMWFGSWLYPVTTAWLPHFKPDQSMLGHSRTLRGKIIPFLLCNLSYHLEHHLYPQVPSFNLPRLAEKLDPYFAERGVYPVKVV
ncbi:fatty acid desaturase family protein [Undibacterium sp. TJN19]|uniref:fatty acid desaturase family protein n=1 Tax=Undibacterium sp. TJN19 TaxID=3413055 RepID=UPI003BF2B901